MKIKKYWNFIKKKKEKENKLKIMRNRQANRFCMVQKIKFYIFYQKCDE